MKKYVIVVVIMCLFILSGCTFFQDYDDIYSDYENHLLDNLEVYNQRIELLNQVNTIVMPGVVSIKKVSSDLTSNAFGSGFIFDEDPFYYYVITNHHVVYDENTSSAIYSITDYKNNSYSALFVVSSNSYDLGVLKFRKRNEDLNVLEFAVDNPVSETNLIVLGYPESQLNTILMGSIERYGIVNITSSETNINVLFDVIYANIPVKSGSSGSVAVNESLEVSGIVFAGDIPTGSTEAIMSYMIPNESIKAFLTENSLKYREVE